MKKIGIYVFLGLSMYSCNVEEDNIEKEKVINYPFEKLDQANFNTITSELKLPNKQVRLDSVVYFTYYQYNPTTGISDYQVPYLKNALAAPPPPSPTHRRTEVYSYNANNNVVVIDHYLNSTIDDLLHKGDFDYSISFLYDLNGNLIKKGSGEDYYQEYIYSNNVLIRQNGLQSNSNFYSQYETINDKVTEKNYSEDKLSSTAIFTLDSFGNIRNIDRNWVGYDTKYNYTFKYPKNIASPFANLFPSNFPSFIYFSDGNGGYKHYSSGILDNYNVQIQVNEYGFPEVIQSGSYDDGYRTKYYYSIVN